MAWLPLLKGNLQSNSRGFAIPVKSIKSNMKKENIKKIVNFIITVLTAALSSFCVQSCQ